MSAGSSSGCSTSEDIVNLSEAISNNASTMRCLLLDDTLSLEDKAREISSVLKGQNVDVNFTYSDNNQNSLLHMAVTYEYANEKSLHSAQSLSTPKRKGDLRRTIVQMLIKYKADVNIKNLLGDTPLHLAVMQNDKSVVDMLIKADANKCIQNLAGKTPLDLAEGINNIAIQNMLESEIHKSESRPTRIGEEHLNHSLYAALPATEEKVLQDQESLPKTVYRFEAGTHKSSGARISNHGIIYQLQLIMLFLLRALKKCYAFRLGTEVDDAEQFDDLVFNYVKSRSSNETRNLYLQAKHSDNRNKILTISNLLPSRPNAKAPFSLLKFYESYLKLKLKLREKVDEIDFAICTNLNFELNTLLYLTENGSKRTLHFKEATSEICKDFFNEGKCYKIVTDCETLDLFCNEYQSYISSKSGRVFRNCYQSEDDVSMDIYRPEDRSNFSKFLNNLIFVVNLELLANDTQIKSELTADPDINFRCDDLFIHSFKDQINDWFMNKKGSYLTDGCVKEIIKSILHEIDNNFVTKFSEVYTEKLLKYRIVFKDQKFDCRLNNLISNQSMTHILLHTETMLTAIQVSQALKKSHTYKKDDSYIVIDFDSLLVESNLKRVVKAFESKTNNDLLVIDCLSTTENGFKTELRSFKQDLLKITDANKNKKIVVLAPEKHPLAKLLKSLTRYHYENVTTEFQDLTPESQHYLLAAEVKFQGQHVELSKVIKEQTYLLDTDTLEALISNEGLVVGSELPTSRGYNKSFYISRSMKLSKPIKKVVNQESFHNQFEGPVATLTHAENVHGITEDDGTLSGANSEGIERQVESMVSQPTFAQWGIQSYSELDFLNLMKAERVVIISDSPGMGKSTVLTHISKQVKIEDPGTLVYIIDLNTKTKELQESATPFDRSGALLFLCDKLIVTKKTFEKVLLSNKKEVVLLFDGFDEISKHCKDVVIGLIAKIKETTAAQICITTRTLMSEGLENELSLVSYSLETFSVQQQVEFLIMFWNHSKYIQDVDKLKSFASTLVKQLSSSISDNERKCTGIPLQLKLLGECRIDDFIRFLDQDLDQDPNVYVHYLISLVDMYEKFIIKKFEGSIMEEFNGVSIIPATSDIQDRVAVFMKSHQWYACSMIVSEQIADLLLPGKSRQNIYCIDILEIVDGKPLFLHQTFAEYLVADLIKEVMNQQNSDKINEFLLYELLYFDEYMTVRTFLNGLLAISKPQKEAIIEFGNMMSLSYETNKKEMMKRIFFRTAEEGSHHILHFLCDCLQKHPQLLMKLLLCTDAKTKRTMLHVAAENNDNTLTNILLSETSDKNDIAKKNVIELLKAVDKNQSTWLHLASSLGHSEVIQTLLQWPLDHLTNGQEILKLMLKAQTTDKSTPLHLAAKEGHSHLIQTLLQWFRRDTLDERHAILRWLLVTTDLSRRTILHLAAENGHFLVMKTITLSKIPHPEGHAILRKLLLAKDNRNRTVRDVLEKQGNGILVTELLQWIDTYLNQNVKVGVSLLQIDDGEGRTAIVSEEGQEHDGDKLSLSLEKLTL